MRANSIFSHLTEETTVAEIKMILSSDYKKKRTVVMLEGEDDVKVFRFLVSKDVTLVKAYGASTTVDKFMPKHFPSEKRVIGIRDKDYQEKKKFERIFYCDYCCAEMMLISDDETFERVCENFYSGNQTPLALRKEMLRKLFLISVIRKCSHKGKWGLKISDTDLAKVINPDFEPRRAEVIKFINGYNSKSKITPEREKIIAMHRDSGRVEDYLEITNGHDFLEVFRIYCTHNSSNNRRRSITEKALGGALRCAYTRDAFRQTSLYEQLLGYGEKNGLFIVRE